MDDKFPPRIPQEKLEELVHTGQIVRITTFDDHMRPDMTWIEPSEFSAAFDEIVGAEKMDFGDAVRALKAGHKVAREGWNGKDMFLFLVPGSQFTVNRPPLLGIYPEGTEIDYHPHIDMKTAQGYVVPWLASQADMLSEDWVYVDAST